MEKMQKSNKKKVPKITEEEYAAYITALKESDDSEKLQKNKSIE